jgi:hypothetical protein
MARCLTHVGSLIGTKVLGLKVRKQPPQGLGFFKKRFLKTNLIEKTSRDESRSFHHVLWIYPDHPLVLSKVSILTKRYNIKAIQ